MQGNRIQSSEVFLFKINESLRNNSIKVDSPGRINLIGEHTDYNYGYVLPTAIDRKIYFEIWKNDTEETCNIFSKTYNTSFSFQISEIKKSELTWENYILGIVSEILKSKKSISGFDCIINSELPIGAGISSSAALECGLASGLNKIFDLGYSKQEIVSLSQAAENNFVGSQCGIMDQFASVMSKKDHIILLDCLTLKAEFIPANFDNCKILLINTGVSHNLADGEYNVRRSQCEEGLKIIQQKFKEVKTLRDVDKLMLDSCKEELSVVIYNRIFYVLEENNRVLQSADLIKESNLKAFGKLMYQSHYGLRDLYEVSCKELDFLVNLTEDKEYIYGSRMMGGGFGGCTINLIEANKVEEFIAEVSNQYQTKFNSIPETITVLPSEGTIIH